MALPIGGARGRLLPVSEGDHGRSQSVSCSVVSHSFNPMDCSLPGSSVHGISQARMGSHSTGVGCHSLLQGILPTQGWNPGPPPWGHILDHLSLQAVFLLKGRSAVMSGSLCCQNPKTVNGSHRLRMTTALLQKRGNETAYPNLLLTKSFYQHGDKI